MRIEFSERVMIGLDFSLNWPTLGRLEFAAPEIAMFRPGTWLATVGALKITTAPGIETVRIACIHQGYELYGSDRCFVESVAAIRKAFPQAEIEVVLPRAGPIVALLEDVADLIAIEPIWVLRRRSLPRLIILGAVQLPIALARAVRRLRRSDLIYVNTSVIIDYQLAARFFPGKVLLHIHELPTGVGRLIFCGLAHWSAAEIIFNSRATKKAFAPIGARSSHVIYNGLSGPSELETTSFDGSRPLRVLMLGRVNWWKGQEILLGAIASLPQSVRARLTVRIVGGAFENPRREKALCELVGALGLDQNVSVEPFVADPSSLYRWADVVAVPSQLHESLGRVAIEAMAYGRPAIVSAIGGLTEVIADERTGWFVAPGDVAALAARLRAIVEEPQAWRDFGVAARQRFEALFSESAASSAIASVLTNKLGRARPTGQASRRSQLSATRP
jgi:glycosyltransferase involved in cell wall biosynthesis